ncbi:MAG TPA: CsbD family protein [Polyangia bacterium]|nr:CsbD family protein [Polyangia bacterium]
MKDELKREIKGKAENLKGRAKEAGGALSGNKAMQGEGTVERVAGAAKEKIAEVERKMDRPRETEEADDE